MSLVRIGDKLCAETKGILMLRFASLALLAAICIPSGLAEAAGLVWQLPEDGTAATFRGTYTQLVRRTDPSQQNVDLTWTRVLTVRSVGTDQGTFRGETVPCRWIEIEQQTGEVVGGEIQTGPGGTILIKVLVPEKLVLSTVTDEIGIPVSFLPIAQGWKQIGDGEALPLTSEAIDLTPSVTLLGFPRSLTAGGAGAAMDVGSVRLTTSQWTSQEVSESSTRRTSTNTELWRSPEAPFGVAKWTVSVKLERKESTAPRDEYIPADEVTETMELVEVTTGAVSKLNP